MCLRLSGLQLVFHLIFADANFSFSPVLISRRHASDVRRPMRCHAEGPTESSDYTLITRSDSYQRFNPLRPAPESPPSADSSIRPFGSAKNTTE